jgi:Phosphodiester glycosidase/FlgD Ig-like domain
VTVRLILPDSWHSVVSALGGGPLLVRGGKPVFATGEHFDETDLTSRQARTAVGQLPDGHVILVAVEGGRPGSSVGMTTYELAKTMASLGAVTAAGLQYGRFVEAAFDGQPLTRPQQGSNQVPVKEALLVQYAGVYALPPVPALVGKANAAAGVQLSYRITHPSTVTAVVTSPDGTSHPIDSGSREPGTYRFGFTGLDAEGTWHWNVQATDDENRASTADQTFVFDETLTGLAVPPSVPVGAGLRAGFTLSRPASVVLQIDAENGTQVATLPSYQLPAGAQSAVWDGTLASGAKAPPGSYEAIVTDTSSVGTSSDTASFSVHR